MLISFVVIAYLLGAIPFALIIARLFKLPDPRTYGSGNVGATNIARSGNRTAAILTLIADLSKGIVAVATGIAVEAPPAIIAAIGTAVVVGHIFSVFLRFRGGRGVATALGVFLAWQPLGGALALFTWALVFAVSRYSSLASIVAVSVAAVFCAVQLPPPIAAAAAVNAALIIFRHRQNIVRLYNGSESRFKK